MAKQKKRGRKSSRRGKAGKRRRGKTDGEIPDADVVTDDGAAADAPGGEGGDGEVCEVIILFYQMFSSCSASPTFDNKPTGEKSCSCPRTGSSTKPYPLFHHDSLVISAPQVLMFDRGDGTYSLKFIQNKC